MSETLFDLSQYKSASGDSDHSDSIDATGAEPAWNEPSLPLASALSINELATDAASSTSLVLSEPPASSRTLLLAIEAEEYSHPCDYAQACAQDLVARFEVEQQQQVKSKKRSRPVAPSTSAAGTGD